MEFINGVSVREYTLADLKEITIGAEVHGEQPRPPSHGIIIFQPRCASLLQCTRTNTLTRASARTPPHTQGTTVEVDARRDGRAFSVTLTRVYPEAKNVTNDGIRQIVR